MKSFFIFSFAVCLIATGCNKEGSGTTDTKYASVSVYAVAQGAPEVNVFLNGTNVAASVPYGSYTLYNRVSPGTVRLQAQSSSQNISADTSFSSMQNQYYSVFLTGTRTAIKATVLPDSFPVLQGTSCGLRFLVVSTGVSNIDLLLLKSGDSTKTKYGWINRSYTDNLTADTINTFKKFGYGTYSIYAISRASSKDTIAKFGSKTFSDSSNYTLLMEGHLSAGDTSLLLGTRLH